MAHYIARVREGGVIIFYEVCNSHLHACVVAHKFWDYLDPKSDNINIEVAPLYSEVR